MQPTPRRLLLVSAALALVLAACGDTEPTGVTSPTTTSTPSTTVAVTTTTTLAAPDATTTAPPETTTTTTEAPDTTNGVIVGFEGVLGWWDGSDWLDLEDGEPPATEGDTYHLIQLGTETTTALGGLVMGGCEFIEGSRAIDVGIDVDTWPSPTPIGVSTDSDLMPHVVEILDPPPAVYTDIVSGLLASRGVIDETPNLTQVIRTDLEGDGVDEILIAAQRHTGESPFPLELGDYSILLLRKIVQGTVETAIIADFIVTEPDSFFPLDTAWFTAVADFNGDGTMEIAYSSAYHEGSATFLVEYVDDDLGPVHVLSVGCGV